MVKIVLVDNTPERKLPFGLRYPDAQGPKTSGNCYNEQGQYTCFLTVAEGEPGADLDVAATLRVKGVKQMQGPVETLDVRDLADRSKRRTASKARGQVREPWRYLRRLGVP